MMQTQWHTRLARIGRLMAWLWRSGRRLRALGEVTPQVRATALREMSSECLRILQVKVEPNNWQETSGVLVVANHVSWLDIFVISHLYPSSFIAMKEIKSWPMIGKIVQNAGAVFIDRSNRKDIDPINAAIATALDNGQNVCFFPEARTSLGNGVLPLKAALFQAAINSQSAVLPIALRYYTHEQRTEAVSFCGRNLLVSLWKIVSLPSIEVKADCADAFVPDGDRFATKERVEQFLQQQVWADSPNPARLLPE